MIQETSGDIFSCDAEVLVNPVNCMGVMGAGLAAEFKRRFPIAYSNYKRDCLTQKLVLGTLSITPKGDKYIVCLPTKAHWKEKSRLEYVSSGLDALVNFIKTNNVTSVAIPALGCGLGALSWADVRPLIVNKMKELDCQVWLFAPRS